MVLRAFGRPLPAMIRPPTTGLRRPLPAMNRPPFFWALCSPWGLPHKTTKALLRQWCRAESTQVCDNSLFSSTPAASIAPGGPAGEDGRGASSGLGAWPILAASAPPFAAAAARCPHASRGTVSNQCLASGDGVAAPIFFAYHSGRLGPS